MDDIIKGHAEFIKSLEIFVKTLNELLASEEKKWTILGDRVKNIIDIIDK